MKIELPIETWSPELAYEVIKVLGCLGDLIWDIHGEGIVAFGLDAEDSEQEAENISQQELGLDDTLF